MNFSKALIFVCGVAVGGVTVQALPFANQWRHDYQAARALERVKARERASVAGVDAEFVPDRGAEGEKRTVKQYEAPFGSDVELRKWKLLAPDDVHRQITAALTAEKSVRSGRAFNESAAHGARQSKHAVEEVELPNLRANITLLNNLIASTTQELVDVQVMKELAIQRATSTAQVDQAVATALAGDLRLKSLRAEQAKADAQLAARKMASRNQNSVEIRLLQRQHAQLTAGVTERADALTHEVKQKLAKQPNEKLRAAITEYAIRSNASLTRLSEYREALEKANKRMLALQQILDSAKKPPTADSAI